MTEPAPREIFVYGTLLPGQANYEWIAPIIESRKAARTRGRLFHLPFGYPAMVEADAGWVRGELLGFGSQIERALEVCDEIEGYMPCDEASSLFVRVVRLVESVDAESRHAWCYCLAPKRVNSLISLGREIEGGDWPAFLSGQDK